MCLRAEHLRQHIILIAAVVHCHAAHGGIAARETGRQGRDEDATDDVAYVVLALLDNEVVVIGIVARNRCLEVVDVVT